MSTYSPLSTCSLTQTQDKRPPSPCLVTIYPWMLFPLYYITVTAKKWETRSPSYHRKKVGREWGTHLHEVLALSNLPFHGHAIQLGFFHGDEHTTNEIVTRKLVVVIHLHHQHLRVELLRQDGPELKHLIKHRIEVFLHNFRLQNLFPAWEEEHHNERIWGSHEDVLHRQVVCSLISSLY